MRPLIHSGRILEELEARGAVTERGVERISD
jgi:hypothetical protein